MRTLNEAVKAVAAIYPYAHPTGTTAAARSNAIDTAGYNTAMFVLNIGTATGTLTALTLDAQVYEGVSSTGTFTATAGSATMVQLTGIQAGTTTGKVVTLPLEGIGTDRMRYLKIIVTQGGTPTDKTVEVSSMALLGNAFKNPVGNSKTAA